MKLFNEFEDLEEDLPDQSVTYGVYIPPLQSDHFSLSPEWQKYKAGLTEVVPPSATEVVNDWRGYAYALSGQTEETE
jgi:hypothetical protein